MFDAFFKFIRTKMAQSLVGAFDDANEIIQARTEEKSEPVLIEPKTNGKPKRRIAAK